MHAQRAHLVRLTEGGDRDAAAQLWVEARRAGELREAGLAAAVLGDLAGVATMLDALAEAGDRAAVEALADRVGVRLDDAALTGLEALLGQVNDVCLRQPRAHTLDRLAVLRGLLEARHGKPCWFVATGGDARIGHAAVCMVVRRPDGVLTVGFTVTAYGFGPATPGAWDELGDWSDGDEHDQMRLMRWASHTRAPDRMQVRSTPARASLRPRDRLQLMADELDQLLTLPTDLRVFERIVGVLHSAFSVDVEGALALVNQTRDVLARWPDAQRAMHFSQLTGQLPDPIAGLAREAWLPVGSREVLRLVAATRALHDCRNLHLRLETPHVAPGELMRAALSLVERCELRGLYLEHGMTPGACLHHARPASLCELWMHTNRAIVHQVRDPVLLDGLESLHLAGPGDPRPGEALDRDALDVLLASPRVSALRSLELAACPGGLDAVVTSPYLSSLRSLTARGPGVDDDAVAQLGRRQRPGLTRLVLASNQVGPEAVRGLVDGPSAATLETLHLLGHRIGDRGCVLLGNQALPALRELALVGDRRAGGEPRVGRYGMHGLASGSWLSGLEVLDLSHNPIGDHGLAAVLDGRTPTRLQTLVLRGCSLGLDGLEHLAASPPLPALRELLLASNPLSEGDSLDRARALIARSWLSRLERVELGVSVPQG